MEEISVPILELEYRTEREDIDNCYDVITKAETDDVDQIKDLLDNIIITHSDTEPSGWEESGLGYRVGGGSDYYIGYTKHGRGKKWVLVEIKDRYHWSMRSNAVEVCDEFGCGFVPACPTGSGSIEIILHIKPLTRDELEEWMEWMEPLEEPETLRETLLEYLSEYPMLTDLETTVIRELIGKLETGSKTNTAKRRHPVKA